MSVLNIDHCNYTCVPGCTMVYPGFLLSHFVSFALRRSLYHLNYNLIISKLFHTSETHINLSQPFNRTCKLLYKLRVSVILLVVQSIQGAPERNTILHLFVCAHFILEIRFFFLQKKGFMTVLDKRDVAEFLSCLMQLEI